MFTDNIETHQYRTKITNVDIDNILLPSKNILNNNQKFRIKAVIQHIGDSTHSGHYKAIVRTVTGWQTISDSDLESTDSYLINNLTDIMLMFLERI